MDEKTKNRLGVEENKPTDWFEKLYSEANYSIAAIENLTKNSFGNWLWHG